MADMQTAVEVLARALPRVTMDASRVSAAAILAEIAPLIRAPDPLLAEALEALRWMVENDETNEGDDPLPNRGGRTWNEINAYYIAGLNRARAVLAKDGR